MRRLPVHVRVEHPADVRAAMARGASRFEVALRPGSLAEADYRIARIRARAGPRAALGIDASAAGWDVDEARRALLRLAAYAPSWVIDPVPASDLAALGPRSVPVVLDLRRGGAALAALREAGAVGVLVPADDAVEALAAGLRPFVVLEGRPETRSEVSLDDRLAGPTPVGGPWLGRGVVITLACSVDVADEHPGVALPDDTVLLARGGPLDLHQGDLLAASARHLRP